MSARELRLVIALGVILGLGGGGLLVYQWFYKPLNEYNKTISRLKNEIEKKDDELYATLQERKLLQRARLMSLSPNIETAQAEYGKILERILYDSGLEKDDFRPTIEMQEGRANQPQQAIKAAHRVVTYQVRAHGELGQLVQALHAIKTTPLIHRIRSLSIDRQDLTKAKTDRLVISMRIEAMIVGGAEPHVDGPLAPDQRLVAVEALLAVRRGPAGLGLLPWALGPTGPFAKQALALESGYRQYADMERKNIFRGGVPPEKKEEQEGDPPVDFDVTDYVRLDMTDPDNREAFLRNLVFNMKPIRLRSSSWSGFNTFRIYTGELRSHVLLTGKVLRIEQRDVYFQVLDEIYCIHLGQTLHDAMWRPASDAVLERLNLKVDEAWAEQQRKERKQPQTAQKKKKGPR